MLAESLQQEVASLKRRLEEAEEGAFQAHEEVMRLESKAQSLRQEAMANGEAASRAEGLLSAKEKSLAAVYDQLDRGRREWEEQREVLSKRVTELQRQAEAGGVGSPRVSEREAVVMRAQLSVMRAHAWSHEADKGLWAEACRDLVHECSRAVDDCKALSLDDCKALSPQGRIERRFAPSFVRSVSIASVRGLHVHQFRDAAAVSSAEADPSGRVGSSPSSSARWDRGVGGGGRVAKSLRGSLTGSSRFASLSNKAGPEASFEGGAASPTQHASVEASQLFPLLSSHSVLATQRSPTSAAEQSLKPSGMLSSSGSFASHTPEDLVYPIPHETFSMSATASSLHSPFCSYDATPRDFVVSASPPVDEGDALSEDKAIHSTQRDAIHSTQRDAEGGTRASPGPQMARVLRTESVVKCDNRVEIRRVVTEEAPRVLTSSAHSSATTNALSSSSSDILSRAV